MLVIMIMMMTVVFPQPSSVMPDSFPAPTYLLFKGDEGLRRNYVIVKTGKDAKIIQKKFGLPLMQCALIKSSAVTGKDPVSPNFLNFIQQKF